MTKSRLDEALVTRSLAPSRSRARDMVLRGSVRINGVVSHKPSRSVTETDTLGVDDTAQAYVSRAALKLIHALDHFNLSPKDKSCLDIGASTGGFTQVLLERGATHVVALDVGHGQLVPILADDPRVTSIEGQNARDLSNLDLDPPQFITADVSFISLKLALAPALSMQAKKPSSPRMRGPRLSSDETAESLGPGLRRDDGSRELIALIKPQFEVGRERLPRDGVVKDPALQEAVCADISRFVEAEGWTALGIIASPIEGGDGNREFLLAARKK